MKKILVLSIIIAAIAVIFASCKSGDARSNSPSASQNVACTLSVVRNDGNGGNVSVIVNGSTLSNPGPLTRAAGTVVTVRADAASGFTFQNWTATSGSLPTFIGGSATSAVITFQMNSHVLIRANFQATGGGTRYMLTVNRNTVAGGNVKVNNVDTNPSAPLSFTAGAQVSLSATANNGFTFQNWTAQGGNVANTNSATTTIQMNGNVTVTANFQASNTPVNPTTYTLTVNAGNGGSVSRDPSKGAYNAGETVQIKATPNNGYTFTNWTGANVANANSATTTIQMNSNATVTANFQQQQGGGPDIPIGNGTVNTYPFPSGLPQYGNGVTMTAGGQNIQLFSVKVNNARSYSNGVGGRTDIPVAMFDMSGTPQVTVTLPNTNDVVIRPRKKNINFSTSGTTITFNLPGTGQYSVEWGNGSISPATPQNALLIFANPIETFNGRTLGPGQHGGQTVGANETLVLAAGAVIKNGNVDLQQNGAKLVGRGIIDGRENNGWGPDGNPGNAQLPVVMYDKRSVEIRGITILDPAGWAMQIQESDGVTIDNVKIISSRWNSDGISLQSSRNVTVTNSFVRSWDDGIVIKNYGSNSSNITVNNCILWTDLAQAMEIGFETNKGERGGPAISNVRFENVTVFHALHKAPISIHNGDNAEITGAVFTNIVIENFQSGQGDGWDLICDITNVDAGYIQGAWSGWTKVGGNQGSIQGSVSNVEVMGGKGSRNIRKQGDRINVNTPWG